MPVDQRDQLLAWIDDTRKTQRRLAIGVAVGAAVGVVLLVVLGGIGGAVLGIVALVAVIGFWITGSHLTDFRHRLSVLDRPQPVPGRRYQR